MIKNTPYGPPKGGETKVSNEETKGQESKPKRYSSKKTWDKMTQGQYTEADANFKDLYKDLEVCVFDLRLRDSDKLARIMKELDRYLGETYCQPVIMTETLVDLPDPEILNTVTDTGS